jgi:hypothetical protein
VRRVWPLVIVAVLSAFPVAAQESSVADAADRPALLTVRFCSAAGTCRWSSASQRSTKAATQEPFARSSHRRPELHAGVFSPVVMSIEAGLVLPFADRNQIDVWVSHRISGDPDDWFVSAGFVRRLR